MLSHGLKTPPFGSSFISNSSRISRYWKLSGETGGHVMFSNNSSLSGVGFLKVFVLNYYYLRQITLFYIFFIENISTYTTQEKLRGLISLLHPWPIYKPSIIFQFIPQHFVFGWGTFSDNKQLPRARRTHNANVRERHEKLRKSVHLYTSSRTSTAAKAGCSFWTSAKYSRPSCYWLPTISATFFEKWYEIRQYFSKRL